MALVLIVDDEALIRFGAADMLQDAGHTTLEASNADHAIVILEIRNDIEVVFSDINMPGSMDGLRLVHVIQARWPPIKLILTSGKGLAADAIVPAGCVFLSKPYSAGELGRAVSRLLPVP